MPLPSPSPARAGVTLLELLIVLTLLGVAAAVVTPVFRRSGSGIDGDGAAMGDAALLRARRLAIQRAEPLRLRRDAGGWRITTARDGAVLDSARGASEAGPSEILVDALGSCVPAADGRASGAWDPLRCTWASSDSTTAAAVPR